MSELKELLAQMQGISDDFYLSSARSGFHQFLEVNGFLVTLIKMCRLMLEQGVDFQMNELWLEVEQAHYVGEKLGCIFGHDLGQKENFTAFFLGLFELPPNARVTYDETEEELVIRLGRRPKSEVPSEGEG